MESRLYVGNLSDDVSVESLRRRFAEYGTVADVQLATDRQSGRMRGHAFVTMGTPEEAQRAMSQLNGSVFDDRRLRVNLAGDRDGAQTKAPVTAKITSQFRERNCMVYELDCQGTSISIKMFPADPAEREWRLDVTVRPAVGAEPTAIITASAPTRAAAFEEASRSWSTSGQPNVDWSATREALMSVRAL